VSELKGLKRGETEGDVIVVQYEEGIVMKRREGEVM